MTSEQQIPDLPTSSKRSEWSHSEHIKRESRHIFNKLHSIFHDSSFVRQIHSLYPSLLLTANLRCGAWYTDPAITSAVSYFKSTDGHTHQWSFSLKRSNLHLLPSILEAGGAIVVDSTRRGKSMPDALSKTIPIWCAVLNAASNRKHGCPSPNTEGFELETPQWMIPPSEHDQIGKRIDGFVDSLVDSDLDVSRLDKPLKPIFVTPQTKLETMPSLDDRSTLNFTPIVLVSASSFVSDSADLSTNSEGDDNGLKEDSFVYVQGAGDDHENWARGLTPDMFWKHQAELLACEKNRLEAMVDSLVAEEKGGHAAHWFSPLASSSSTEGTESDILAGGDVEVGETGLFIGSRSADHTFSSVELDRYKLAIHFTTLPPPSHPTTDAVADQLSSLHLSPQKGKIYSIHMAPNKKGLSNIRSTFPPAIQLAHQTLTTTSSPSPNVLICCQDGRDLSGSLIVAILTTCFDDQRRLLRSQQEMERHGEEVSKDTTKRRLQWLVSSNPRAAPSRAFLLRVNELLLSHRHRPASNGTS